MNRLTTASVLVVVLVFAVIGALIVANGQRTSPPVTSAPLESVPATSAAATASASPEGPISTRGAAYHSSATRAPTAQSPQSKLWFAAGRWWGVLADVNDRFSIQWLDWRTQVWHDTGTLVDERSAARADVLWDDGKLYIATAGGRPTAAADAIRVLRYSFDAARARYTLDDGFPVIVADGGAESLTIARDGMGRTWIAYLGADGLALMSTDGDDHRWSAPFQPVAPSDALPAEAAAIVAQPNRVVLVWTAGADDAVYSAVHDAGDPPREAWRVTRTPVDGLINGPDQIDVKAGDGTDGPVFAAVRTSLAERDDANGRDPQVLLLELRADGSWAQTVVSLVTDHGTWPLVSIDEERGSVTVFSVAPGSGGVVYAKTAAIDALDFGAGIGLPFVVSGQDGELNRPTTTKQPVSADTGLVVLAADDRTGRYVHAAIGLGGVAPGSGEHPDASGAPVSSETDVVLFSDGFDVYPANAPIPRGWQLSDAGTGTMEIVAAPSAQDHSARLAAASAAVAATVCRELPALSAGDLHVHAQVMVFGGPATDAAKLILLRGRGLELASVRLNEDGTLTYSSGLDRQRLDIAFDRERWFAVDVTMHLDTHAYDWALVDISSGTQVATASDVPWRATDRVPDRLCFGTATGPGSGILFDDVRVTR
jgi:hypothetical protein